MRKNITLNQICVLSALVNQDRYGLDIIKSVKDQSNITIILGSLYNILGKLEREGFVESYWGEGDGKTDRGGHRRRYYKITGAGQNALNELQSGLANLWGLSFG